MISSRFRFTALLAVCIAVPACSSDKGTGPAPDPSTKVEKVYWVNDTGLFRSNPDGTNVETVVDEVLTGPQAIAIDSGARNVYWSESRRTGPNLRRTGLDGGRVEDLILNPVVPAGIALDVTAGKIYWTEYWRENRIQCSNLDGTGIEAVVSAGLQTPGGIALDLDARKMYWTDWDANLIMHADMTGANIDTLLSGLSIPEAIALDVPGGKIYWCETGPNTISRANTDGSGAKVLVNLNSAPWSIALDTRSGHVYWALYGENKIQRANLDGSNIVDVIDTASPIAIALELKRAFAPAQMEAQSPPDPTTFQAGVFADSARALDCVGGNCFPAVCLGLDTGAHGCHLPDGPLPVPG